MSESCEVFVSLKFVHKIVTFRRKQKGLRRGMVAKIADTARYRTERKLAFNNYRHFVSFRLGFQRMQDESVRRLMFRGN